MFLSFEYSKRIFLFYNGFTESPFSHVPKLYVDQSMSPNELRHHAMKKKGYNRWHRTVIKSSRVVSLCWIVLVGNNFTIANLLVWRFKFRKKFLSICFQILWWSQRNVTVMECSVQLQNLFHWALFHFLLTKKYWLSGSNILSL